MGPNFIIMLDISVMKIVAALNVIWFINEYIKIFILNS